MSVTDLIARISSGLEHGEIPAEIFNHDELFQTEMQRIFARSWVFLGFLSEIPKTNDFMLRNIGLDRVIVTRGKGSEVNVVANFCRHRGTQLCHNDYGNTTRFRCPYHGWTYKNNGDWVGAPDKTKAYAGIDPKQWGLLKAPKVEVFLGMIFASLDLDAPPLMDYLGGAAWMMRAAMDLHPAGMTVMGPPDRYRVRGDWKTAAENFSGDIYHVGVAHGSIQTIRLAEGFDTVNDFAIHHIYENGHGFLCHDFHKMFGEGSKLWYYDPSIQEHFDLSRLDDQQRDLVVKAPPIVGTVFPNLSFLRYFGPPSLGKPPVVYTSWRQWQPAGPGQIDIYSWQLKWDFMTQQQADDSYAAGVFGFSSSGLYEQDDTVVWEGAPHAAKSVWAQKAKATFNYQMGLPGMGVQARDLDWKGPGEVFRPGPGEASMRNFYRQYLAAMTRAG